MGTNSFESRQSISMTPDGSVQWLVQDMPNLYSTLYLRPPDGTLHEPDSADIGNLVAFAQHGTQVAPNMERLSRGTYGTAYRMGNFANKRALNRNEHDEQVGLGAAQAMVALNEGLRRLGSTKITAPVPYAVLLPGKDAPDSVRTSMLMAYVTGSTPSHGRNIGLPSAKKRQRIYDAAIQQVGAEPGDIHYDDSVENLKLRRRFGVVRSVTKLDVAAQPSFVRKMGREPSRAYQDPDWT
ncbi:MAG TPA: hypothetical protein VF733_02560 [Candidatus Saccharimonadales bacterium]